MIFLEESSKENSGIPIGEIKTLHWDWVWKFTFSNCKQALNSFFIPFTMGCISAHSFQSPAKNSMNINFCLGAGVFKTGIVFSEILLRASFLRANMINAKKTTNRTNTRTVLFIDTVYRSFTYGVFLNPTSRHYQSIAWKDGRVRQECGKLRIAGLFFDWGRFGNL